jgi:hypothetical protein
MRPMRSRPAWPPVTLTRTDWECFLAVSNEVGIIPVTLAGGSQATKIARYAQRPIKRQNDRRQLILGFTEFPAGWWIWRQGRWRSLFFAFDKTVADRCTNRNLRYCPGSVLWRNGRPVVLPVVALSIIG